MSSLHDEEYFVYQDILKDLFEPISENLDSETKKSLYSSKLVYLNHLRKKVFLLLNSETEKSQFTSSDLENIMEAIKTNQNYIKNLYIDQSH